MSSWKSWYTHLKKPSFTPSPATISLIWKVLYPIIFISYGYVFYLGYKGDLSFSVLLPFLLNLVFNILFTPIQFGLKKLSLASVDMALVWVTIVWSILAIWPYSIPIALLQIPYLLWVSVASYLQFSLTWLNMPEQSR